MKTLRRGTPVTVGDVELIPIESTFVSAEAIGGALTGFASKEITAIIVRSPAGQRALGLDGRELPMEELARQLDAEL
jgi:hypothetical protein